MGHEIPQIDLEEIQIPLHFLAGIGEKISSKQVERCCSTERPHIKRQRPWAHLRNDF